MYLVEFTKQIIGRYYPREHLVAASLLGLVLLGFWIFPNTGHSPAAATRIELPIPAISSAIPEQISQSPEARTGSSLDRVLVGPLPQPISSDSWLHKEVKAGDTLSAIFKQVGLHDRDIYQLLNSGKEAAVLNKIYPGYQLSFDIPEPGQLEKLQVFKSPLEGYLFTLVDGFYEVEVIKRTPEIHTEFKHGTIADSLFVAGQRAEVPAITIMEMANIFGGVIDFILDPRIGDNFSILFEEKYLDGQFIGTGEIMAAQFTNQGKQYVAVRYTDEEGETGYYNPDGESMRKAFLRTPLDVFRISSNFNLARRHPILNTIRAHKGTDYAAPTGTPVRATSDGTVTWAARNGSFGKLIVVKHSGGFETKYAHLSNYANGIKKGSRVHQGDVIGYVGMTGGATGPHLHYEFLVNGVHQNPRTIVDKLPKAVSIAAEKLPRFRTQSADLLAKFTDLENTRLMTANQLGAE